MRVAVTNPVDRARGLAAAMERAGLTPVSLACTKVVANSEHELAQARRSAERADLLVVSSSRTIEMLWPDGGMPAVDVVAVGPATAATVQAAGGHVSFVGHGGTADLATFVARRHSSSTIHLTATNGVALAVDGVRRVGVYTTLPIPPASAPVDAVAFTSPSAVVGWTSARDLAGLVVGAIGETTASALRGFGCHPLVPDTPSYETLAETLAATSSKTKESA